MRRFTWIVPGMAFVVAMTIAACGSNGNGGNPTPTPTPTPTWTWSPTPTGSSGGTCQVTDYNSGRRVIYSGAQGNATFPDANATYVGQIAGAAIGGSFDFYLPVSFPHLSGAVYVHASTILVEAVCTPTVSGRPVIYIGPAVAGKFPAPAAPPAYSGTITRAYLSISNQPVGWFEVSWAAPLNKTIAVKFSEVYY